MSGFQAAEYMDLEKPDQSEDPKGSFSSSCSICLEFVLDRGERSIAKLQCGHEFHLDCIGSAFNAKGAMQCPNCRKIEKGHWLYANGICPSTDFDIDGWITENFYDLELPFGFQWCPFRGFTRLTALLDDGDSQPNSYHETLGNGTFGDLSSSSTSTHACPYLALHHAMNIAHSSSSISVPENSLFHRHPTTNMGAQPSVEMRNPHNFSAAEVQNSNWPQQTAPPSMSLNGNSDHSASLYGLRLSRNDTSNQPRVGSFVQAHPLIHGSMGARNGNNLIASSMAPHARSHSQAVSSSSSRVSTFAPARRPRPRGLALISTSSSTDIGALYGFSVSNSATRSHQDSDRHFDRYYGWGRESFTPLPWIPLEGESQWWSPFNPNQPPQTGSFVRRGGSSGDRITQNHSENGYQRIPLPPWMPPPPPPPFM